MRTAVLFALALCFALPAHGIKKPANDEAAVKMLMDQFAAAWNKHDPKAMVAYWAEDSTLINPVGRVANGRNAIQELLKEEHASFMKDSTIEVKDVTFQWFKKDLVLGDFDVAISGMKTPDGKTSPEKKHHIATVAMKKDGKWWIAAARPYIFVEMPAPSPQ